jgi:hypothetical protein
MVRLLRLHGLDWGKATIKSLDVEQKPSSESQGTFRKGDPALDA